VSDLVVSYLRTIVPILWGALITWALGAVSWLPDALAFLNLDPQSAGVVTGVTGLVVAAWYVVWRKIEPSIPAWLTSIVLGASTAPTYAKPSLEDVADAQAAGNDHTKFPYVDEPIDALTKAADEARNA